MKVFVQLVSVALCCVLAVPAIADAKKIKRSPTGITFEVGPGTVDAELSSSVKRCLRKRSVSLAERDSGVVFFATTSTRDGHFSIPLDEIPGGISAVRVAVASKSFGKRLCQAASADATADDATLSGGPSNGAFRGVLSSSVDGCEPNRMISLYEVSSDPVFVGWNFTDASGAWTIAQAGGAYEARADPVAVGGGSTFTYCRPLVSPTWSYEESPEQLPE